MNYGAVTTEFLSALSGYGNDDTENIFPVKFFDFLRDHKILNIDLPVGSPEEQLSIVSIVMLLKAIGRKNLSVGRIFEGNLNAVQLTRSFAAPDQLTKWSEDVREQNYLESGILEARTVLKSLRSNTARLDYQAQKPFAPGLIL